MAAPRHRAAPRHHHISATTHVTRERGVGRTCEPFVSGPLEAMPGYSKCVRKVCKAEWDYEVTVVFSGLDNFRAYMESDEREQNVAPLLTQIQEKYAVGGEVLSQNFVYEEY